MEGPGPDSPGSTWLPEEPSPKASIKRARFLCASCKNVLILYRVLETDFAFMPFRLQELYELSEDVEPSYPAFKARVVRMLEAGLLERVGYGQYRLNLTGEEQQLVEVLARICMGGDEA